MTFSLVAELPLGTYRGRVQGQVADRVPSPARLQAALLAAAGFGPRSVLRDDEWGPCDADVAALRWIEENPPDSVSVPRLTVTANSAVAYREDGTFGGSKAAPTLNKLGKQEPVVAVDGPFVWSWSTEPPTPVAEALRALCPDVSHLGSAESPVRLRADRGDIEPTHRRGTDDDAFTASPRFDLAVAAPGRLDELGAAHGAAGARPGKDGVTTDERSRSVIVARTRVRSVPYLTVDRAQVDVPWPTVLLIPLEMEQEPRGVIERERVRWSVAAHRALIGLLDRDAPPILTGAYGEGVPRPGNRVALHLLSHDQPADLAGPAMALAVMIPAHAADADAEKVYDAVSRLRSLHPRGRAARVSGAVEIRSGDRFWPAPAVGARRLWRTSPPAVPDTRGHDGWTFTHAALLSLGFVHQDRLPRAAGRGHQRDQSIVDHVNAAGAVVLGTEPVRTSRVGDYAHRVHRDAVVRPYRTTLHLGDLVPDTALTAIGQARHLGGGLLVPDDRPEGSRLGGTDR